MGRHVSARPTPAPKALITLLADVEAQQLVTEPIEGADAVFEPEIELHRAIAGYGCVWASGTAADPAVQPMLNLVAAF